MYPFQILLLSLLLILKQQAHSLQEVLKLFRVVHWLRRRTVHLGQVEDPSAKDGDPAK